jgi:rhodanese-related sulfurtransferase
MLITPRPKAHLLLARRRITTIAPRDLRAELDRAGDELRLFDTRAPADYACGHIGDAVRLDAKLLKRGRRVRRDHVSVLYGADALAEEPYLLAWRLAEERFPVIVLEGGYAAWREECGDEPEAEPASLFAVLHLSAGATA